MIEYSEIELREMISNLRLVKEVSNDYELQQAKVLFEECGFQRKEKAKQEMSKFINQLAIKNGTTNY